MWVRLVASQSRADDDAVSSTAGLRRPCTQADQRAALATHTQSECEVRSQPLHQIHPVVTQHNSSRTETPATPLCLHARVGASRTLQHHQKQSSNSAASNAHALCAGNQGVVGVSTWQDLIQTTRKQRQKRQMDVKQRENNRDMYMFKNHTPVFELDCCASQIPCLECTQRAGCTAFHAERQRAWASSQHTSGTCVLPVASCPQAWWSGLGTSLIHIPNSPGSEPTLLPRSPTSSTCSASSWMYTPLRVGRFSKSWKKERAVSAETPASPTDVLTPAPPALLLLPLPPPMLLLLLPPTMEGPDAARQNQHRPYTFNFFSHICNWSEYSDF